MCRVLLPQLRAAWLGRFFKADECAHLGLVAVEHTDKVAHLGDGHSTSLTEKMICFDLPELSRRIEINQIDRLIADVALENFVVIAGVELVLWERSRLEQE